MKALKKNKFSGPSPPINDLRANVKISRWLLFCPNLGR